MSDDINAPETEPEENPNLRNLREKAKQADQLATEKAALERELAFARAGLPLDDPKMSYFVKGYEGELTAEAIKQAATQAGFLETPKEPVIPPDEAAQLAQIGQNVTGTGTPSPPPSHEAELRAAAASGEIRDAYDIANWLQARGEPVAWDGPIGDPTPWGGLNA